MNVRAWRTSKSADLKWVSYCLKVKWPEVMATQSRAKVCAARDEASLASAILQIMASREVARGTPSRVRSCLQRPCGALSDHMAPDTSCCDAAATRARIDTEDSALSSCHREAASRVKGHRKVRCS